MQEMYSKFAEIKQNKPRKYVFYLVFILAAIMSLGVVVISIFLSGSSQEESFFVSPVETLIVKAPDNKSTQVKPKRIYIDVSGAVEKPGVYILEEGARLAEVIAAAGGMSKTANTAYIAKELNLSRKIENEEKIFIPHAHDQELAQKSQNTDQNDSQISVNAASQKELDSLPGVGEKTAEKIIQNRPYLSLEEFQDKNKISAANFEKMKDSLSL